MTDAIANYYSKPFKSVEEQLLLLRGRGMDISNEIEARLVLANIGYYRLSGYSYPFRSIDPVSGTKSSRFRAGTSLDAVVRLYEFDRSLRMLVFDAIESLEVALRFELGHHLGRSGAFSHHDPEKFSSNFTSAKPSKMSLPNGSSYHYISSEHSDLIKEIQKQEQRSKETFAEHFRTNYGPSLPIWVATEVMSLGTLIHLFDGLPQRDRELLAERFDVVNGDSRGDISTMSNWLNHIRYIRNTCAHHSRLWNRNFDVTISEPTSLRELSHLAGTLSLRRVYGTLAILAFLVTRSHPSSGWRSRIVEFATSAPLRYGVPLRDMGFPSGWTGFELWQTDYSRDEILAKRRTQLSAVETVTLGGARDLLTSVAVKDRGGRISYLRKKWAILALTPGKTRYFPTFQFDSTAGEVSQLTISANRRLFVIYRSESPSDLPWKMLDWWTTACPDMGGETPQDRILAGTFTREDLDRILPGEED